ncbi:MAG: hypothetical protein CVV49_14465, partial [Spirochaetae bacterium HGW-Spirochaetae-5]
MKINQIPDIYIEQYVLDELPENIRKEIDALILENPSLLTRIEEIKKSNENIISLYPAESMVPEIMEKNSRVNRFKRTSSRDRNSAVKDFIKKLNSLSSKRYTLPLASAAAAVVIIFLMIPGVNITENFTKGYDTDIRIKGLESKLIIYRMKGKEVEELKNSDTARQGDIIQLGYIAADNFKYGTIISIDGRGTVTLHHPDSAESHSELIMNKKVLLNRSYELDDSPSFERFIMILSAEPVNTGEILYKAKKLAKNRESSLNGFIDAGKDTAEFSAVIKKI